MSLAKLAEFKDTDTGEHIQRVSLLTSKIVTRLHGQGLFEKDIDTAFVQQAGIASTLHDIGKVGIPETILLKPAKLTVEEFEIMKTHSAIGGKILQGAAEKLGGKNYLHIAANIAHYHHEKFDGKGYPDGLKGDGIPISARIVSVVDVYDALTSKRPYKKAFSQKDSLDIMNKEMAGSFDPRVVEALLFVLENDPDFKQIPA
jgi:HD-GYP domain-containing protein (c-di-GMP phosphodiesterase class II)